MTAGRDWSRPVGNRCPLCGAAPLAGIVLGAGRQAFCPSPDCAVMTWDPTKTLAELNADTGTIDVSFLEPPDPGSEVIE